MLIRRRPSAATVVAVLVTLVVGSQTGLAAHLTQNDHKDSTTLNAVPSVDVTAADESSVTIDWLPSQDNGSVAGYDVYVNATQVGTVTPDRLRKWRDKGRDRESFSYTVGDLQCGTSYTVAVDAFDRDDNHSPMTEATVSTAACPKTTSPPSSTENPTTPSSSESATTPSSTTQKAASPSPSSETTATPSSSPSSPTQSTETPSSPTQKTATSSPRRTDKVGSNGRSPHKDGVAPQAVSSIQVTAADASSVSIGWPATRDNDGVVGYDVYLNDVKNGTVNPDRVLTGHTKRNDQTSLSYTIGKLACGTGYTVGVDAFDRQGNRSPMTRTTVSTSACPDTLPPSSPSGMRQLATTENSVTLTWSPSTDNVGVVEYGLYTAGLRVSTVHDANATLTNLECGTNYLVGIDAADAAGNRSAQASAYFRTSACPVTNQPPSTPTGLKVTTSTQSSVTLAWTASTDDVAVSGYGLYTSGTRTSETTNTTATFSELQCGTTYALGVDAFDGAGARSSVAQLTAATSPCSPPPTSPTPTLTQTITNGETVSGNVTWHATYDSNGDKVPDDPGAMRFLVDGKVVLTEQSMPFGDSAGFWTSSSVSNGPHTFEVAAVNGSGTTLATDTVSANVANQTAPTGDTTAPSTPGSLRVTSATETSVSIAWSASTDNVGVAGYGLYRGTNPTGQTQQTTTTFTGLACGTAYQVGVDAYDAAGNRSPRADLSITTSPCPDTQPPTAPTNVTASNRTTTSITLTWAPATDNVGVAAYSLYNGGDLVGATSGTTGIISGLQCGTDYTLGVDAFDAAGNSSPKTVVMVSTLACPDTTPPTVTLTAPTSGSVVTATVNASANATDNVGVAHVDFFRDGVSAGSDTSAPYTIPVDTTTISNGSHTFGARAYDAAGNTGTASNVTVTVSNAVADTTAPTVALTAPTNGATVSGTMTSAVNATDNVGVARVEFLRDGVVYGQDTTAPYSTTLDTTTVTNGSHAFGARAYDAAGNVGNATNATVTVSNATAGACGLSATPSNFATQVNAATAGQTVCLATGNYGTWTGTNKAITIRADTGASPQMRVNFDSSDSGFTLDGMTGMGGVITSATNVTIRNSVFSDSLDLEGNNHNVLLDHNTHNWNAVYGGGGINAKIFFAVTNNGTLASPAVTIRNSEIKNGNLDGIHQGGGAGLLVLNNTFDNLCDTGTNHTDNIQFEGGSQTRIAGNYVHGPAGCAGQGITSFDGGTDGLVIENNVVDMHRPWGIELYSDKNSIVRHNTVVWKPDSGCDFTGITCGQIDLDRKSSDPAGAGTHVYDNVADVSFSAGSTGTADHNVSGQNAIYVGPTNFHDGFLLAANSPVGQNAASDGTDVGVFH